MHWAIRQAHISTSLMCDNQPELSTRDCHFSIELLPSLEAVSKMMTKNKLEINTKTD